MTDNAHSREGEPERELGHNHQSDEYEQFVDFFENAAVPMHWVGPDGTILHANQAELDALGYSREEYVGRHIADFHADQEVIDDILDRLSSDEELHDYEARMERKDGSIRHVLIDSCVNWEDGEFLNTRCVTRDITERRKREREIQRQNERLEEFASIVSHDLRNPLRVAEGQLQLAYEERDWEQLDAVERALGRMDALIENVLALANAGEDLGETESVELGSLAETSWQNVETHGATLNVDTDRTIEADRSQLKQILENLVRNAIEHGGSKITVTVGGLPSGFYVEDDGPGIPESDRANVFDPGYSTDEDGTGFGLSIVRDIAEAHDWEISISEGTDGGARFEFIDIETE